MRVKISPRSSLWFGEGEAGKPVGVYARKMDGQMRKEKEGTSGMEVKGEGEGKGNEKEGGGGSPGVGASTAQPPGQQRPIRARQQLQP
jgi:hypothetical protein